MAAWREAGFRGLPERYRSFSVSGSLARALSLSLSASLSRPALAPLSRSPPPLSLHCVRHSIKTSLRAPFDTALKQIGVGKSELWGFIQVDIKDKIIIVEIGIQGNDSHVRTWCGGKWRRDEGRVWLGKTRGRGEVKVVQEEEALLVVGGCFGGES